MTTFQRVHISVEPNNFALVFVHGLGGHPIHTWRHPDRDAADFWPLGRDGTILSEQH